MSKIFSHNLKFRAKAFSNMTQTLQCSLRTSSCLKKPCGKVAWQQHIFAQQHLVGAVFSVIVLLKIYFSYSKSVGVFLQAPDNFMSWINVS